MMMNASFYLLVNNKLHALFVSNMLFFKLHALFVSNMLGIYTSI